MRKKKHFGVYSVTNRYNKIIWIKYFLEVNFWRKFCAFSYFELKAFRSMFFFVQKVVKTIRLVKLFWGKTTKLIFKWLFLFI